MTLPEALAELAATVCSACGYEKRSGHSFCRGCYNMLPPHMQAALYRKSEYARRHEEAKRCIAQRRLKASEVGAGRFTKIAYKRHA